MSQQKSRSCRSWFRPHRLMFAVVLAFVLTAVPATTIFGQSEDSTDPAVAYEVDLTDVRNHYVTVTAIVPVEADETELMMAVWTPGSYLVREYARHVDSIRATDEDGRELEFRKTRKNRWMIESRGIESVRFRYRVYCNEMSVRTNFVDDRFAMLNGAPTFVTPVGRRDRPHVVRLKLPGMWTRAATSLRDTENAYEYVASDFDELVDSPIVAGAMSVFPFEVGGIPHQLVNVGDDRFWDGTEAAADLKKIVRQHQLMWGTIPYDRYLFLNVIGESGGGLEHDNSTLVLSNRFSFRDRYRSWLSLCSHEFFHTWNVRRLRPKALMEYDYENEVYTRSLWIAEGITSYYEDMLLVRAGIMSEGEFLSILGGSVSSVKSTPGRKKQSLTESSYDTWIKFYRPDQNSSNTRISYYTKGTVVAFLLDAEIQSQTNGRKSLDDVLRVMFEEFSESGFTEKDFRDVSSRVAETDLTDWFKNAVDSTRDLDYGSTTDWFGMSFSADERAQRETRSRNRSLRRQMARAGEEINEDDFPDPDLQRAPEFDPDSPWIGASVSDGTVTRVQPDSPATEAGLNVDDEVIGINGLRTRGSISSIISRMEVGDEVEMLITRRGEIRTLKMTVAPRPRSNWRFGPSSSQSRRQEGRVEKWLAPLTPESARTEIATDENEEEASESSGDSTANAEETPAEEETATDGSATDPPAVAAGTAGDPMSGENGKQEPSSTQEPGGENADDEPADSGAETQNLKWNGWFWSPTADRAPVETFEFRP